MTENDGLTRLLTRSLTERADEMAGSSLALAEVTRRARSIRRRRQATAIAGAVVAGVVVVPGIALLSHSRGTTNEPAPAHTASPTATPSDPGHQPARGVLDVSDLPTGAAPRIAYAQGDTVHRPDGTEVHVGHPIEQFTTLVDGAVVYGAATDGGGFAVRVGPGPGRSYPAAYGVAVNADRTMAGWVSPTGALTVWQEPAHDAIDLGTVASGSEFRIASIAGDDCSGGRPTSLCVVDVNVGDANGGRQPWEVTPDGSTPLTDGSFLTVADQSEDGLTIGLDSVADDGSCSKLLGGREFAGFTTCRNTLVSFSPDGRLILADPAYHDGLGNGVIAMYDLSGHRVFQRTSDETAQAFYPSAQWEDATHVLAPVFQDGRWAVVRFASDGSLEYAVPPVDGDAEHPPFVLETRP